MKYNNLRELQAAYDSGELDPKKVQLLLDNDSSFVYIVEEVDGEIVRDEKVFDGPGPKELCEELLDWVGIPWEHC